MEWFTELNGRCPFCGGEITIIEGDVFEYTLDEMGIPEYLNSEEYRLTGYCKRCRRQVFPLPNGNGTYTVYPYNPMPTINAYSSYVPKRISIISDKVLGSTDENINPFINVRASLENDDNENIENFEDASLIEEDLPF